jgi:hypothetical protein
MKIVLKYGDNLEVFNSVEEADRWLYGDGITFRNGIPDEAWAEDDDCEVLCEYTVINRRLIRG